MHAYVTHQTPCGVGIFLPEGLPGATIAERNGQEMRKIERRGEREKEERGRQTKGNFPQCGSMKLAQPKVFVQTSTQ